MYFRKTARNLSILSLAAASCFAISAEAAPLKTMSQNCELGNTCPIPGNDGGQTRFTVKPKDGTHYLCEIKSDGGSLKFSITSGKDFSIDHGSGLFNANPESTVEIKGRFKNPENTNSQGEIRITQLPTSADGTVKCYPHPEG